MSITNSLNGAYEESQHQPAMDKYGRVISYEKENISIWKENFQSILNRPEPATTADIQEAEEDIDVNLDRITETEVRESIKALRNGKAPCEDGICLEMMKAEEVVKSKILFKMLQLKTPKRDGELTLLSSFQR